MGQRWGIGGVAVAVSIAMGINWLMMAGLGRSVTGLSWIRFAHAQVPGLILAVLVGGAVALAAQAARSAHLGGLAVLIAAALAAAVIAVGVWRLRPERVLGPHGAWASSLVDDLIRKGPSSFGRGRAPADALARANPE